MLNSGNGAERGFSRFRQARGELGRNEVGVPRSNPHHRFLARLRAILGYLSN
jgi:hypothetical protein